MDHIRQTYRRSATVIGNGQNFKGIHLNTNNSPSVSAKLKRFSEFFSTNNISKNLIIPVYSPGPKPSDLLLNYLNSSTKKKYARLPNLRLKNSILSNKYYKAKKAL